MSPSAPLLIEMPGWRPILRQVLTRTAIVSLLPMAVFYTTLSLFGVRAAALVTAGLYYAALLSRLIRRKPVLLISDKMQEALAGSWTCCPDKARRELNWAYDRFVLTYGPINRTTFGETADGHVIRRMPNLVKFREDPDAMLVVSLEDYDEVTGQASKAAILKKDVVGKAPPVTSVRSAEEGLLVSLDQRGAVDLPFIATL